MSQKGELAHPFGFSSPNPIPTRLPHACAFYKRGNQPWRVVILNLNVINLRNQAITRFDPTTGILSEIAILRQLTNRPYSSSAPGNAN